MDPVLLLAAALLWGEPGLFPFAKLLHDGIKKNPIWNFFARKDILKISCVFLIPWVVVLTAVPTRRVSYRL